MKAQIVTVIACLLWLSGHSQVPKSKPMETELKKKIALACKLTDRDQIKRMNELHQTLLKQISRSVEHSDGYELVFQHGGDSMISDLAEFIKFERQCCPWLVFQLTFQPEQGPISLKMGDSEETKQMVYLVMELDKLQPQIMR